jgi:hypothetical protein
MDPQTTTAVVAQTPTKNPWLALLSVIVPVVLGAGLGMWLLQQWYIPKIGMGVHQRTINLGQQLLSQSLPRNSILCLGNSVVREGLDTQIALEQWPKQIASNWHMYNVSISGSGILEQRIMMPRMLACQPQAIVLEFGFVEMGRIDEIHSDKCYAYARAGFSRDVQYDEQLLSIATFTERNRQQLFSSEVEQLLHFRNIPLTNINETLRRIAQPEYLLEGDNNWINPFEMAFDYAPDRLLRHFKSLKHDHAVGLQPNLRDGKSIIRQNIELIQKSGCQPLIVILPIHPELHSFYRDVAGQDVQREFLEFTHELESSYQVAIWDATQLLTAEQFSDAVHPNATGRRTFSTALGQWLSQQLLPTPVPNSPE